MVLRRERLLLNLSSGTQHKQQVNGSDGIHRHLVRYGVMGWVGWFGSIERIDCSRSQRILVRTSRGLEIGEILAAPQDAGPDTAALNSQQPAGEVLRRLTAEEQHREQSLRAEPPGLFNQCRQMFHERQIPVEVIDCERLFDDETLVLYFLGEESPELQPIAEVLGRLHEIKILFQPIIESEQTGCGSGGCNSGGCCG